MVQRHTVPLNSFHSVHGTKHNVIEGTTAEISIPQARKLFASVDASKVVGFGGRKGPIETGCPLEDVQYLAGHSSPVMRRIYDPGVQARDAEYREEDFDLKAPFQRLNLTISTHSQLLE